MDIVSLLVSLNKISLIVLIFVGGFLSYQIYLFKKEANNRRKKIVVPDFKEGNATALLQSATPTAKNEIVSYNKSSLIPIGIGFALFVFFGFVFVFGFFLTKQKGVERNQSITPTPIVHFIASKGITVYNQNWKPLSDALLKKIQPGQKIYIGIEQVKGADIDMARIRINKTKWDGDDITILYNREMNLFYKEFQFGTGSSSLKIEAELHSKEDGWLGD